MSTYLQVHCIGVFKAGKTGGFAINGDQVICEEHQDGLGVSLVAAVRAVGQRGEVDDTELHLEDGGVLAVHEGDGGLGPGDVLGEAPGEHEDTVPVPGREPLHLS